MPARKTPPAATPELAKVAKAATTAKTPVPAKAAKPVAKTAPKSAPKPPPKATTKVPAPAPAPKTAKPRAKLVRDSFTMPQADFVLIDALKLRALGFRRPTKKSELLRAGLQALAAMSPAALQAALGQLVPLKTGRPKKAA